MLRASCRRAGPHVFPHSHTCIQTDMHACVTTLIYMRKDIFAHLPSAVKCCFNSIQRGKWHVPLAQV